MALENAIAVAGGVAVLGLQYVLALYVRETTATIGAAVYGAALLLVSELAHWSLELGAHLRADGAVPRRRFLTIAMLAAAALVLGLAVAIVAGAPLPGSVLLTALGAGSVLAVVAMVTVLLWERQSDGA